MFIPIANPKKLAHRANCQCNPPIENSVAHFPIGKHNLEIRPTKCRSNPIRIDFQLDANPIGHPVFAKDRAVCSYDFAGSCYVENVPFHIPPTVRWRSWERLIRILRNKIFITHNFDIFERVQIQARGRLGTSRHSNALFSPSIFLNDIKAYCNSMRKQFYKRNDNETSSPSLLNLLMLNNLWNAFKNDSFTTILMFI